jgi:hypothetical protein
MFRIRHVLAGVAAPIATLVIAAPVQADLIQPPGKEVWNQHRPATFGMCVQHWGGWYDVASRGPLYPAPGPDASLAAVCVYDN